LRKNAISEQQEQARPLSITAGMKTVEDYYLTFRPAFLPLNGMCKTG
jgi:hypothetical protein